MSKMKVRRKKDSNLEHTDMVSIVIPCYNNERFLSTAIQSALGQTYRKVEVIVVDDASTDNSLQIAREWQRKDGRIKVISLSRNQGAALARNQGVKESTGRYIAYLDADDWWDPDKLTIQIEEMRDHAADFCYSAYAFASSDGRAIGPIVQVKESYTYGQLLKRHRIWTTTVVIDTEKVKRSEIVMPDIKIGEDYCLWLSMLKCGYRGYGVQRVLAYYRRSEGTLTSSMGRVVAARWYVYRKMQHMSLVNSLYHMTYYFADAVYRRLS